jgi:hypothetical protein
VAKFGAGWTFREFIPTAFNGVSASCSEEYDEDGSCSEEEIFIVERLALVGGLYKATQLPDNVYRNDCMDGFCQPDDYYCFDEDCGSYKD